jgi:hypothetical protein
MSPKNLNIKNARERDKAFVFAIALSGQHSNEELVTKSKRKNARGSGQWKTKESISSAGRAVARLIWQIFLPPG